MNTSLLVSVLAASLVASAAREPSWVPVGPPGGGVRALASDPTSPRRVYLGTADGTLYRSDDGGHLWRRMDPGFPRRGCSLDQIVVDARGAVYVGYWEVQGKGGGLARSVDGGRTFASLSALEGESVRALAVAPSNDDEIVAGTLTGVFLSRDAGTTWTRITPADDGDLRNVASLAIDPQEPRIIYAGTRHLAWKTSDGGATWKAIHVGMIEDSHVMTLSFDRVDPRTLYATACTGIYRSIDGGGRWTRMSGIPDSSRRTRSFSQSPADPNLLLAGTTKGLWMSRDDGATWGCATSQQLVVNALLAEPDGSIVLGTETGVLISADRGKTWDASNTGFAEQLVTRVLFDPATHRVIVAVWGAPANSGVFASTNLPVWTPLRNGIDGRQVMSLDLIEGTILAGTDDGLFARAPQANAWSRLPTRLGGREIHPRVTDLLTLPNGRLIAATPQGLIVSPDQGRTWTQPEAVGGEVFALARSRSGFIDVAATDSGFFRSTDGGVTWTRASPRLEGMTIHALAIMPHDDRVVFATTSSGLFRSDDRGATWRRVSGGLPRLDLMGIAAHPDGHTIYVSDFTRGGVFHSADGGETWDRMPTQGLASERVWTLAIDPTAPDRLVAASSAGGLHVWAPASTVTTSAVP